MDYSPNGFGIQRTVYLLTNTKVRKVHKLVMMIQQNLPNVTFETWEALQAPARLVQFELNNPTAKVSGCVSTLNRSPHFTFFNDDMLFCGPVDKAIEFESEFEFSNETMQFIKKSCSSSGWQVENGNCRQFQFGQ